MKHRDRIIELRNEGKTYSEIEKELGCSKGTISYNCSKIEDNETKVEELTELRKKIRRENAKPVQRVTETYCKGCKNKFEKSYNSQLYCLRSCYKKHTGMDECPNCTGMKRNTSKQCFKCLTSSKLTLSFSTTLQELHDRKSVKDKHVSWKNVGVRQHARTWHKDLVNTPCMNCPYDKHTEFCHVIPVSSFPPTATLGEVNNRNNIKILCPNCHWELDNGLLVFE